jgi:ubiquinone/menaquinone biosynthesis C-methylase UbiE
MLDIAEGSGLRLGEGDRILDLGCGAGRMIRHLRHLSARCEIWGTDISAAHITWCKHHLAPPFHFATTTKVPHLPFEDRSFSLIYCGSLFTHIDDLADAWLLELKRILKPGGRLYVTLHDEETIRLFESPRFRHAPIVKMIKASPTWATAAGEFGMFTIGRDEDSQVFYRRAYFERMAASAGLDVLSVTQEAYFYQTAYLLARKDGPAG